MAELAATLKLHARPWRAWSGWRWYALVAGGVVLMPVLVAALAWLQPAPELWAHLASVLLPGLLRNTAVLVLGVGVGSLLIGVSLAWLTATCEFPGRRLFDWALMLPLAVPAYVLAFVFVGLLDFSGPLQTVLREVFGPQFRLPPIRSAGGVIMVLTLALYPYVYMLARAAFLGQGQALFEAARMQGMSPLQAFFRVSLPMARPAIAAGLSLALMETLADFGAVSIFNYDTFTTAIYKAWFGFFSLEMAAQLASLLLLFVLVALFLERRARGRARYFQASLKGRGGRLQLRRPWAWSATALALLVLGCGFLLPVGQLLIWVWQNSAELDSHYISLLLHTLELGTIAALATVVLAVLLAYAKRAERDPLTQRAVASATVGYAMPGSVLAVGIMLSFTWIDNRIAAWLGTGGQWLTGSVLALILAYITRFMAVAYGAVDSSLEQIRPVLNDAARLLGARPMEVIRRVYIPMLRPGLLTAALLVAVDVMKEMPATLLLRPFGWDTLSVRIFELTSEGLWERAALPAVALVTLGLVPVLLLVSRSAQGHQARQRPEVLPETLEQG
ncbi:MAG TPA: iron ABC transporter permease [Gammaproteobacteria bacterium]|nr:iron ABC transporter permease [Gammaproteobacteria bacterium]